MKKLLILSALILSSCSKDEVKCKCTLKVTIDGTGYYYMQGVPTDCNGNFDRPENIPQDHFIVGVQDCE